MTIARITSGSVTNGGEATRQLQRDLDAVAKAGGTAVSLSGDFILRTIKVPPTIRYFIGDGATLRMAPGSMRDETMIRFSGRGISQPKVFFENFKLLGNSSAQVGTPSELQQQTLLFCWCADVTVADCVFQDSAGKGLVVYADGNPVTPVNVTVHDCIFEHCVHGAVAASGIRPTFSLHGVNTTAASILTEPTVGPASVLLDGCNIDGNVNFELPPEKDTAKNGGALSRLVVARTNVQGFIDVAQYGPRFKEGSWKATEVLHWEGSRRFGDRLVIKEAA